MVAKRSNNGINLVNYYDQESPYATEFRRLLHNLNGVETEHKNKIILLTSAMLAEGKSTVASFMAITSARQKKRKTLLVDCDLRRPTLHRLFSVPRDHGVSEALIDNRKLQDIVKKTSEPLLDLVTAGKAVNHPTEVFNVEGIQKLLE